MLFLRDYWTDLFPISKIALCLPLIVGGGLYETGAGGSAPKHVQGFVEEGRLRSTHTHISPLYTGEYLAMAVAYERLAEVGGNSKAKMLGECRNQQGRRSRSQQSQESVAYRQSN